VGGDGGKLAASAGCCAGLRRFAAGAAEAVGEKPLETRIAP